ncbi:ABC-type transport auxiliary lipoprotein family protein [Candidatus Latescibacterota bacterium]
MKTGMMVRNTIRAALLPVMFFLSCSFSSLPTKNYYTINYTPVSHISATSNRPYPFAIQVGRFEVQRIYNSQNITYRFSPHQIQFYELERWAVRPEYMIRDMVFKHLEASNLTNRIGVEFFDSKPDFRIEGTVEALEKLDAGDLFFSHLAITFKMLRVEDGEQLWNYSFDQRRQVYSKEMIHTVQSLSSIFQSQMDLVVGQLDSLFLSFETGKQLIKRGETESAKPVGTDSSAEEIDESAFEIIPEKRQ